MNFTDNNVTFKDILQAGLKTGGNKISSGEYTVDSSDNITRVRPIINAIDIDWLKAEVPGIDNPITSTGQLLSIIGSIKQVIGNISTAPTQSILDRLTIIETTIETGGGGGEIPDDLVQQLSQIGTQISTLQNNTQNLNSRVTALENGGGNQQIANQISALSQRIDNLDTIKHVIIEKDRYDAMTSYDPNTLYFIIGEPDYIIVDGGGGGVTPSTRIDLDSISTQLTINGQLHREDNITLTPGDTYIISGTLAGTITIDASGFTKTQMDDIGNTEIILSDVIIVSDNSTSGILYKTPADNQGFKDLIVTITKNTANIICCRYEQEKAENQFGALHSMNNLVVRGTGYLSVRNDGGHGIRATEVDISGPHIYASAIHDAVHAKKLFWNYGTLYTVQANDVLGTGENGRIIVLGGTFNTASSIEESLFDSKKTGLYNPNISITGKSNMQGMLPFSAQNFASAMNVNYPGYVYKYESKSAYAAGNGEQVNLTNGIYKISGNTHPFISVVGTISNTIEINTSNGVDATVYLNNAYIASNINRPSIYFNPSDKSGKIKIFNVQDSLNIIDNTYSDDTFTIAENYESDAIKSENNINVEIKNGAHMYVTSQCGDGIDGGTMKITDSKGTLVVTHCGQRGLKGNVVVIGPNCEVTASAITSYYKDDTDEENYTKFEGACIIKDNCTKVETGEVISTNKKNTGFADIYARNGGKADKGIFATQNSELDGIIICGTLGAIISIDMDNASNMNYNRIVTQSVQQTKIVTASNETTIAYNIYKEPVT